MGTTMEAIEFQTTIGTDGTISIPESLSKKMHRSKVRVIILEEEQRIFDREETNDRDRDRAYNYINYLMANPIKVDKSIPFLTRDEIYDRRI